MCDYICSNVICMLKYLLIKPKKIFKCFICFWKWFFTFMFLVFVQNAFLCFSSKNWFRGGFLRISWLRASHEKCLREINFFSFHIETLATISWLFRDQQLHAKCCLAKTRSFKIQTEAIATVSLLHHNLRLFAKYFKLQWPFLRLCCYCITCE